MDTPTQVQRAILLLWISLGLGALDTVLGTVLSEPDPGESRYEFLLFSIGVLSLGALFIHFASRRRNWARIVLLIVAVVTDIAYIMVPSDSTPDPTWSVLLMVVSSVLEIIALYWLFFGEGRRWYAEARRQVAV